MSRTAVLAGLVSLLTAVALSGCARRQRNEDFIPAEDAARGALESYLTAWQHGEPVQPVAGTSPAVMAGDMLNSGGRKLSAFAILGPVPADAPRCFLVRLTLDGPGEERRERYVVVGLDPLWVIRFEDYEMLMHWDHPMPATPTTSKK